MGYSKNNQAYLEYHTHTEKVSEHRLVKFIRQNRVEQQTPTDEYDSQIQEGEGREPGGGKGADVPQSEDNPENQVLGVNQENVNAEKTDMSQHEEMNENVVEGKHCSFSAELQPGCVQNHCCRKKK